MTSVSTAQRRATPPRFSPRRAPTYRSRPHGFSLVELLVVIGIIALVMGMLFPALTRARASARATKCMNNLRQVGAFYYMYADLNDDRIPLGTSHSDEGLAPPPVPIAPGLNQPIGLWRTALNHFLWVSGRPSAAAGPLVQSGLIRRGTASLLYCPSEVHGPNFEFDTRENPWPDLDEDVTTSEGRFHTRISYAVRPVSRVWEWKSDLNDVVYPTMPKLVKQKSYALLAELPQVPPANHGTDGHPQFNVLYADGSVRVVSPGSFRDEFAAYVTTGAPPPAPPGFPAHSNAACINEVNPHARAIWNVIDKQ